MVLGLREIVGKDLGVLVDEKLDMSWQCTVTAQEAKLYPWLHKQKRGQQAERGSSPPLPYLTPPGILHPAL